ncbi:MAG: glycosyltransferase family 4 protein [Planctomycetes bacterium]|nr:glycosyltransferase family 4 protein [Planctomycetota bacterium]
MRVLFLTDSLSDLDGVGRYSVCLLRALEEAQPGIEIEVLLARKHRPTSSDVRPHWKVSVALPPDYFYYMSFARFWTSFVACAWRVRARARHADLVHAIKDYPHNFAGLFGARLAGVPCIATAHGTYSVQPLLSSRHARLARWTYARLAALISVSRYTKTRLEKLLDGRALAREKVHVIPNAVAYEHYQTARAVGERAWHAQPYTLAIGEVKERKGHHLSLAAFCRVAPSRPEWHHYVIGHALGDAYEQRLRDMTVAAGVADRVHFLGNITEDLKIDLLQRARVFVHTPVTAQDGGFEGFGIVYLEAAACGVPAIGTLDSGAEDAVVDGSTGYLVAQEVEAVTTALTRLIDEPALCKRMGEAGRAHARTSSWRDNAERVLEIYAASLRSR